MPLFRRKPKEHHRVVIEELRRSIDDKEPFFVPKCECGWRGSVWPTKNEAFAEAYSHGSNVSDELTYSVHEPGHVLCLFCGDQIEMKPGLISLFAVWTEEDGQEQEQMFWAHRLCLIEHATDDEWVGGPLWGT